MTYPPLPPNCPFFRKSLGRDCFASSWQQPDISLWLDDAQNYDDVAPIIAAVARCAWLDEAEKYPAKFMKYGDNPHLENKRHECQCRADAWAAWGRGEKWE